jgi:hypothetical protein
MMNTLAKEQGWRDIKQNVPHHPPWELNRGFPLYILWLFGFVLTAHVNLGTVGREMLPPN